MGSVTMLAVLAAVLGCTVVLGAAVEDPNLVTLEDQTKALSESPNVRRILKTVHSYTKGRSFFRTMGEEIMNYLGFGDEEDYEEYEEYFYPSFDSQVIGGGNSGSSYSFYNPYENYHPARDDNFEEEDEYGWGDFMFDAAVVAVPMAIALAAMPTGLFTIPILGRSFNNHIEDELRDFEMPALRAIEKADFLSLSTRDCQEKIFCEVAQIGRHTDASLLQKMIYLAATLTPDQYAENYGLEKLLKASRSGHCEMFKCVPLMTPATLSKQVDAQA